LILAFDIYGTLFEVKIPGLKEEILKEWRQLQIEFTWRITLMRKWLNFDEITAIALKYLSSKYGFEFKEELLEEWTKLKPFDDVEYLKTLSRKYKIYALTNGTFMSVRKLLKNAGLLQYFNGIFTAEEVKFYKPSPSIYQVFMNKFEGEKIYLVSSNPFDIAGAKNAGMKTIYLNRYNLPHDPLADKPDFEIKSLSEIEKLNLN
jgi:2-haloalkanoic acid dehalogenase type II